MRKWNFRASPGAVASSLGALALLIAVPAGAQDEEAPAEVAAEGDADAEPAAAEGEGEEAPAAEESDAEAPAEEADAAPEEPDASAGGTDQAAEIEALKAAVADLQAKAEEAEMAALLGGSEEIDVEQETFKVYGFMDMGAQRQWVEKDSLVGAYFETNATQFVVGNIDLYFDFNPDPDWRGLAEIRFTNAPHGRLEDFGGITGDDFKRANTQQFDPHATQVNAPMWGGYTVIERAWIEWKKYQQFKVRTGSFFTPFGIWNVDHGSPTLISSAMPQFIQQQFIPIRQVGVQALGSFFLSDWELAYRAWISNGRQDYTTLDFDDDKAFGARTFLRKDGGAFNAQFGASFHRDKVKNKIVDVTGAPPFTDSIEFETYASREYIETIVGLDISVDIDDTRIRAEGTAQLRQHSEGKREGIGITSPVPGANYADYWRYSAYLLVAQQLPFWGLEPYMYAEVIQQDWELGDGLAMLAPGLNVRFTPAAMLKLQFTRAIFFNWMRDGDIPNPGQNNVTSVLGRVVLAF